MPAEELEQLGIIQAPLFIQFLKGRALLISQQIIL
jgi:hypothetical protein